MNPFRWRELEEERKREQEAKEQRAEQAAKERARLEARHEAETRLRAEAIERERRAAFVERLKDSTFVDRLKPLEFERLVLALFRQEGWTASATAITGDEGIDGQLEKSGTRAILQCKHTPRVGQPTLRDFYGTMVRQSDAAFEQDDSALLGMQQVSHLPVLSSGQRR